MTNQPPPLDAERVSDERLAELIARTGDDILHLCDEKDVNTLLRELQRLRALPSLSNGVAMTSPTRGEPMTTDDIAAIRKTVGSLGRGCSIGDSHWLLDEVARLQAELRATQRESGGESVSVPREWLEVAEKACTKLARDQAPSVLSSRYLAAAMAIARALSASQRKLT